jgi:peptidoglycan/LPS O-acetylase OafA/YrhL
MSEVKPASSRILEFEALRALSIILLLPLHSGIFDFHVLGIYLGPFAAFVGAFLLGSFFFLAGYFSEISLGKKNETFLSFIWSKIVRIFPPYWFALLLFILILGYSLRRRDLAVYFLNLQFLFAPPMVKQMLTMWYVSIVFAYFVAFGFLLSRKVSSLILFLLSLALFIAAYIIYIQTGLFDGRVFEYFFIFLAGIYFARFSPLREKILALPFLLKLLFSVIGTAAFLFVLNAKYFFTSWQYLIAVDVYILTSILLWLAIFSLPFGKWRIWSFVSYASFFAYLFHRPIWAIINALVGKVDWQTSVLIIVFPGSVVVFCVAYGLQALYDRLLLALRPVSKM